MLKNTLKPPKTDKKTKAIVDTCGSIDDLCQVILSFWDRDAVDGSDLSFLLNRLSDLGSKTNASENEIESFTSIAGAVLGKTYSAAKKEHRYDWYDLLLKLKNATGVNALAFENQKIWKFIFISGDFFRLRSAALAWQRAEGTAEKDAAAQQMRDILYPIMIDNVKFKFPGISAVRSRIDDLLKGDMMNIFPMMAISTEAPFKQTLTQEKAPEAYQKSTAAGAELLKSLSVPDRIDEAKGDIASMLDNKNGTSLEWLNVRNLYGDRAEAVRTALLEGKFGFGSPGAKDGCANFINNGPSHSAEWLKDIIQTSIKKVTPQIELLSQELLNSSEVSDAQSEEWLAGIRISKVLINEYDTYNGGPGSFASDLKEVFKLARGRIRTLKNIDLLRGRSFASMAKKSISLNPRGGKRTLWHEVGHHFEFSNPDYLVMARAYLADRTQGNNTAIAKLNGFYENGVYGDSEIAIADHLSSPYIGKIYGGSTIDSAVFTEVFSSGFEYLSQPNSGAISLVNNDGLIEFVTGVLKGA